MSTSAGKVLLMPKGDYNASTTYSVLDWVRYNNAVYVAKQTTTGNLPTNTTYWEKMIDSVSTLSGLSDVNITNIADGEILIWDATNSEWINGTISSGGSIITVTTTTEQGNAISMVIDGHTYSGTFSAQGVCQFEGVKEIGIATFTSGSLSNTLVIQYYGAYTIDVSVMPHIFGVEWDGTSSSAMTRTDGSADFVDPVSEQTNRAGSSPFDSIMPWAGIERVTDSSAGELVKIPKFWYKWTRSGSTMKLQISNESETGFFVSPAHADRGDGSGERDYVYVGAYMCDSSTYKSLTGVTPVKNQVIATTRSYIHNLGANIWQYDFAMHWTIAMLYLVEFANWNSEAMIAPAISMTGYSMQATGKTDSLTYHTGATDGATGSVQPRVRYRYIEDIFSNGFVFTDGIMVHSSLVFGVKNPANFTNDIYGTGVSQIGETLGRTTTISSYYITKWNTPTTGFEYALCPIELDGSETTYICDHSNVGASDGNTICSVNVGGNLSANVNSAAGMFSFEKLNIANSSSGVGCRLMKLP